MHHYHATTVCPSWHDFSRWQIYQESRTGRFALEKGHVTGTEGRTRKEHGKGSRELDRRDLHHSRCLFRKFSAKGGFFSVQIVQNSISAGRPVLCPGPFWGSLQRSQSPRPSSRMRSGCPLPIPYPLDAFYPSNQGDR